MALEPVLDDIVRCVTEALHPERVYLFGSRARGDARPDSDYDLLVLVREQADQSPSLNGIYDALWTARKRWPKDQRRGVDIVVWPVEKFERRAHLAADLPATVLREGRLLYAA